MEDLFSRSVKKDWEKIATHETQKKNPFEILSWRGKDGILYLPYYDSEDTAALHFLNSFQIAAADAGPRSWGNLPAIKVTDEVNANTLALNHLSFGVDGILFDVRKQHPTDCTRLLHDIEWPHCFLAFKVKQDAFVDSLAEFIKSKFDPESLRGTLFWETIPKINTVDFYLQHCKNARCIGLIIAETSPAEEICDALLKGAHTVETFRTAAAIPTIFSHLAFSLPVDASLVETMSKLKALRMLWYQVAQAYGNNDYKLSDLHIHAYSARVADDAYGPHENMLKGTFAAIGAIAGGCDSLSVESDAQPPFVARQARNISAILQEESFFGQVADPIAGSYAVDAITNAIAAKAWSMFQEKWHAL